MIYNHIWLIIVQWQLLNDLFEAVSSGHGQCAWDRTCFSQSQEVLWLKILHSNTQQQVTPYPVEHATCKVQTCDIILGNKDFMFVLLCLIPISSLSWTSIICIIMDSCCLLWQINKDLYSEYLIMKCNILIHTEHNRRTDQNRRWENKKQWIWKSEKRKFSQVYNETNVTHAQLMLELFTHCWYLVLSLEFKSGIRLQV